MILRSEKNWTPLNMKYPPLDKYRLWENNLTERPGDGAVQVKWLDHLIYSYYSRGRLWNTGYWILHRWSIDCRAESRIRTLYSGKLNNIFSNPSRLNMQSYMQTFKPIVSNFHNLKTIIPFNHTKLQLLQIPARRLMQFLNVISNMVNHS